MGSEHLVLQRIAFRPRGAARPTRVLFIALGGMGDMIVAEALVRKAVSEAAGRVRVIVALPWRGGNYDARHYPVVPDEVWIARDVEPGTVERVHALAREVFGSEGPVETEHYAHFGGAVTPSDFADAPPLDPGDAPGAEGRRSIPLYERVAAAAAAGLYPTFRVQPWARRASDPAFAEGARTRPGRPFAIHGRSRPGDADKNPDPAPLAAFLDAWRARTNGPAVVVGAEDVPEPLLRAADVREIANPDPSLQTLAAALERCSLFVGGDSGPLHLAAALGVPVIALLAPHRPLRWGPFAPPDRMAVVVGTPGPDPATGFRFDPELVLREAERLSDHREQR